MSEDRRDVLQVLRYELNYLEQGGYRRKLNGSAQISPFQDTLSCLNFGEPHRPHACRECLLFDFVPEERRTEDVPCHFIPLGEDGRTASEYLKNSDFDALENAMKQWLQRKISTIEQERTTTTETVTK